MFLCFYIKTHITYAQLPGMTDYMILVRLSPILHILFVVIPYAKQSHEMVFDEFPSIC